MGIPVLCLRPLKDFVEVDVHPPSGFSIAYGLMDDPWVLAARDEAEALVLPSVGPPLTEDWLAEVRHLKLVQFTGAGWDRVPRGWIERTRCPVSNVAGANASDVAEYVLLTAGWLLRRFKAGEQLLRQGQYGAARQALAAEGVRSFSDLTAGIIGLGHIGWTVAQRLASLGMRVVYFDAQTHYAKQAAEAGMVSMALDELLTVSDVVTLHVPLLPETRGLLGEHELDRLKPDAILIQASRGGVVNEDALLDRLLDGRLAGAAVDVYSQEPLAEGTRWLTEGGHVQDRLILTPHIAGVTRQAAQRLYTEAWSNVTRVLLDGQSPANQVR